MMIAFLVVVMALLSFQFFTVTTKINVLNRVVVNTPISLFEASIPLVSDEEEISLYFDKPLLEANLSDYYQHNLHRYVKRYTLSYYYYNQEDQSYCVDDLCNAVEVSITANVVFSFSYSRIMFYEIRSSHYGS